MCTKIESPCLFGFSTFMQAHDDYFFNNFTLLYKTLSNLTKLNIKPLNWLSDLLRKCCQIFSVL